MLGNGETCNGDQARRAGNEFVFQGLAQQNVETFKEYKVKKVVSTCAHCFNTLKNEYKEFGVELEVVHHTQLLNRLVREGKLTPVKDGDGAHKRKITYHDPCYIGRHNGVYSPPRELLQVLPGAEFVEMERNSERSFCCGAGGARMWMEENIGERINVNRTNEAVGHRRGPDRGRLPVLPGDALRRPDRRDRQGRRPRGGRGPRRRADAARLGEGRDGHPARARLGRRGPAAGGGTATALKERTEETKAEPEEGDATQTEADNTVTETSEVGPAAKASGGGSSLFDTPADDAAEEDAEDQPETASRTRPRQEEAKAAKPASSGGSLFDLGGDDEPEAEAEEKPRRRKKDAGEPTRPAEPAKDLGSGGSLFDLGGDDEPEPEATSRSEPRSAGRARARGRARGTGHAAADLGSGGSLFDIEAEEPAAKAEPEPEADSETEDAPVEPGSRRSLRGRSRGSRRAPEPPPTSAPVARCSTSPRPRSSTAPEPRAQRSRSPSPRTRPSPRPRPRTRPRTTSPTRSCPPAPR